MFQQTLWPLIRQRAADANGTWQFVQAALHTLSGAALGLLFWLSWGLAAIVNISWWLRGLTFGLLIWSAVALPALVIARAETRQSAAALLGIAVEMLSTCLLAGLACSWTWERAS